MQLWKLRSLTICCLKAGEPERLVVGFSVSPKAQKQVWVMEPEDPTATA